VDGVGNPVVVAALPDDRVGVVLAAVVDSHPHPESEGGLTVTDGLAAGGVVLVGRDANVGVEPVEDLLVGPLGRWVSDRLGASASPARRRFDLQSALNLVFPSRRRY
jgi:hypothetical protein